MFAPHGSWLKHANGAAKHRRLDAHSELSAPEFAAWPFDRDFYRRRRISQGTSPDQEKLNPFSSQKKSRFAGRFSSQRKSRILGPQEVARFFLKSV